ncbi:hypothetical protein DQW50_09470 [Halorubrum sp. 48-1-W]|uniref:DUF7569 family protein n=1 Tax=Halorubrum sp. 48-1-W TaxID=2249761 RepID=UPI000DCBEB7E|nr:hypothetical protein [Halorubrum sp. 48-1-W]RAW45363.1 hypothetical protein DQW50_09470 [Halorubrum sp. 48-1-W]
MSDATTTDPCDACGEPTTDALARTVRLSVDRANIDTQRLCPECFAEWIERYQTEMGGGAEPTDGSDSEIIVD